MLRTAHTMLDKAIVLDERVGALVLEVKAAAAAHDRQWGGPFAWGSITPASMAREDASAQRLWNLREQLRAVKAERDWFFSLALTSEEAEGPVR